MKTAILLILLGCSFSCTTYRWRVVSIENGSDKDLERRCLSEGGMWNPASLSCSAIIRTTASDKNLCIATAIFWGGYCWFMSPDDNDREIAEQKGRRIFGPNAKISDYIGKE